MLFVSKIRIQSYSIALFVLSLISGCNSVKDTSIANKSDLKSINCPIPPEKPPLIRIDREEYGFYHAFNYQIEDIVADTDAISFESLRHKFTLCRANSNWIVEEMANVHSSDNSEAEANTIELKDKTYQFGVSLTRDSSTAIFELITPESTQPKQQILYNLEQTKKARAGVELGEPIISPAVVYGDRLFWSIFAYRGEGFGGIATIVSYNPTTDEISVIQPPEIATQIINDFIITGDPEQPIFWLATQLTGEGSPYLPSMGLVVYRPTSLDYTSGEIDSYRVDNSPLVGAIPTKLHAEKDLLWIGAGNGVCQVKWQNINSNDSWDCWRFALMSELPKEGVTIYRSLLDDAADTTMKPDNENQSTEVLWWLPQQYEPLQGRFEIEYQSGKIALSNIGATTWDEYYYGDLEPPVWNPPLHWAGGSWHWEGNKFVRGFDEVDLNLVGGGARGISLGEPNNDYIFDTQALRGDLELLELTKDSTKVKYYSAWVDDSFLQPYLTILPQEKSFVSQPNPLLKVKSKLK